MFIWGPACGEKYQRNNTSMATQNAGWVVVAPRGSASKQVLGGQCPQSLAPKTGDTLPTLMVIDVTNQYKTFCGGQSHKAPFCVGSVVQILPWWDMMGTKRAWTSQHPRLTNGRACSSRMCHFWGTVNGGWYPPWQPSLCCFSVVDCSVPHGFLTVACWMLKGRANIEGQSRDPVSQQQLEVCFFLLPE